MQSVTIEYIIDYMTSTYNGVMVNHNWGEQGLFYNPNNALPKGVYIMTFKEKDGPNDKASNVDREGVFRLNLGISKEAFMRLFSAIPKRPAAGEVVASGHDFPMLDCIMPHPVYGWMSWVGVNNPSPSTFEKLKPLIEESVAIAIQKFNKKVNA